jgi:hemoglobin
MDAVSTREMDVQARRAAITADIQARTGIDEEMIERLVHTFYGRVREDALLAPIFDAVISDWGPHLERMCAFWSAVALMSGRYHGQPLAKHVPLPVGGRHFDRWLALFAETASDVCPPVAAAHFMELSRRIARSMEMGMASSRGLRLDGGERLPG